jgi:hypothetical protein
VSRPRLICSGGEASFSDGVLKGRMMLSKFTARRYYSVGIFMMPTTHNGYLVRYVENCFTYTCTPG